MSVTARAAVLPRAGEPFVVRDIRIEEPRDDEVLVRLVATGLCHTDLGVRFGGIPFPLPGVIGHEGAGIVLRAGSAVDEVEPGDSVVLSFSSCGACDSCVAGRPAYCVEWYARNIGRGARADGSTALSLAQEPLGAHFFGQSSFAEYAVVDRRSVVKVPSDADLAMLAPLGCGVLTGFGSVWNVLDVQPAHRTAVFGTGAVGLAGVIAAALRGARTLIAVDVVPERLELARELGATHTFDGRDPALADRIREATGGLGLHRAFDTTGNPGVGRTAIDALGTGGTVAVCGAPPPGTEIPVDIQGVLVGKSLVGVTMGAADPRELIPELVRLHADGELPLERLVGHYPLDRIEDAVADMHGGRRVKPVIVFGDR
ncbi:NAD(P)-dependent alcohol dehydrogenase [Microbacterium marinilacus]|uniref:NAD(P)-dependent alcohol dehydrogenase n=1 Tax=Microbacterium marinilacus TaxID=415209 RepID=A0ABP7BVU5_9MICO|nr:NAD(P)-dependent alcohol dehydrogenase [Microbacterium marinilacus]MBY0689058.1 NAD(P)-dependent alcohol dehydrogenase [Microbacterium marinilacus]